MNAHDDSARSDRRIRTERSCPWFVKLDEERLMR